MAGVRRHDGDAAVTGAVPGAEAPDDRNGPDYRTVNRAGWDYLAGGTPDETDEALTEASSRARQLVDPFHWIPWGAVTTVLCLASAGGQQAPLFAAVGCRVTSVDLSPRQLARDADLCARRGLPIRCVESDMTNLSVLGPETFDFVYHQVSACYIPDVNPVYRQVARHLRPGGHYMVQHWNPVQLQLSDVEPDGTYRLVRPQQPAGPIPWMAPGHLGQIPESLCWHYIHRLHDLIGGLTRSGFVIERFAELGAADPEAEPGSHDHRAAYAPPYFVILATRTGDMSTAEPGGEA